MSDKTDTNSYLSNSLNADKSTQKLSSSSTVEEYNYKLSPTDYAAVSQAVGINHSWEERSNSISICLEKLGASASDELIDNCYKKMYANYSTYY